jgi:hypothetical protein
MKSLPCVDNTPRLKKTEEKLIEQLITGLLPSSNRGLSVEIDTRDRRYMVTMIKQQ